MPAPILKIDKWTGALLRILKKEAVAQCRVQYFGRSRCLTARSLRIAVPNFEQSFAIGQSSAMPRARTRADRLTTRAAHTQVMRAVRMPSQLAWDFLR